MSNFFDTATTDYTQETYTYQGDEVFLITVFHEENNHIALVENKNGEQFEIPKNLLHKTQNMVAQF